MRIATLEKLLKQISQEIDKKRAEIMLKESLIMQLKQESMAVEEEVNHEKTFIESSQTILCGFGEFAEFMHKKQLALLKEISIASQEEDILREELKEVFMVQKKYEYLLNTYKRKKLLKEQKSEQAALDEFKRKHR